jgi:hypothetical protein
MLKRKMLDPQDLPFNREDRDYCRNIAISRVIRAEAPGVRLVGLRGSFFEMAQQVQ